MQGLRFNSSLLFLHTKHSGYIDGPLLYRLVIHGMIGTFTAILTKREGALHFLDGQFVLSFIVSVSDSVTEYINYLNAETNSYETTWDLL